MAGGRQGRAGDKGDETFQMEQGDHLFRREQYEAEKCPKVEDEKFCTRF